MRRLSLILACVMGGAQHAATAEEAPALLWADEFNSDGPPDPTKWGFERGFVRNHEDQWYRPENAVCSGGLLVIEGRRERLPNPRHDPRSTNWRLRRHEARYTSSSLTTRDKFAWRYGRLEVRARIVAAPGLWPAIWTLGESGPWPDCGEVDLMEHYDASLLANACWGGPGGVPQWDATKRPLARWPAGWAEGFHVWRMDWDADRIVLSVDGEELNTIRFDQVSVRGEGPHPFRQPHYVLLNLAIGGDRGGDPSQTPFPTRYEVDYVRVYKPAD